MRKQPRPTALLSIVALVALVLPLLSTPALQARAPESDSVAPAAVINLTAVAGDSPGTVELSWIAPGDDGSTGTATKYIVRYNSAPITEMQPFKKRKPELLSASLRSL